MDLISRPRARTALWNRRSLMAALCLIVTFAVAAAAAFWLFSRYQDQRDAAAVRRALAEKRLDEAEHLLERWIQRRPGAAQAYSLKARLAWARQDFPAVQEALTRARALGIPLKELGGLRGLLMAKANQNAEAEPLLLEAAETSARIDPDVALALTRLYLGEFRLGGAAMIIDRWMRDWPDDARPYFLKTEIDSRNGGTAEELIVLYQAALERDPDYDEARLRLADTLRLNHRNEEAAREYARYLEHRPDDAMAHLGAGQNALDLQDPVAAMTHLDRALALAPRDPVILGARAAVEIRLGHLDAALHDLNQAVAADPFDYGNRYQRMLLLGRLGKPAEAETERQAIDQIRRDVSEFADLGRKLEHDPKNMQLRSKAARWLMDHGHEGEAVDWAKLVLRTVPSDPAMNRMLADYYRRQGNFGLANFHEAHAASALIQKNQAPSVP